MFIQENLKWKQLRRVWWTVVLKPQFNHSCDPLWLLWQSPHCFPLPLKPAYPSWPWGSKIITLHCDGKPPEEDGAGGARLDPQAVHVRSFDPHWDPHRQTSALHKVAFPEIHQARYRNSSQPCSDGGSPWRSPWPIFSTQLCGQLPNPAAQYVEFCWFDSRSLQSPP